MTGEAARELEHDLAQYLRLLAGALDAGGLCIEQFKSNKSVNDLSESRFAQLTGEFHGYRHSVVLSSSARLYADPKSFMPYKLQR